MAAGRHLDKWIWRHNSADYHRITTKFGRQMQNGMPMTIHRSKSKPDIEFQYGGRPFSETGSISAVDWDISSKFGMQIDFHLLKQTLLLNLNRKYISDSMAAILKIWYDIITPPSIVRYYEIWQADVKWHADDSTHVKIETENRFPIWRPSDFWNRKYLSRGLRYLVEIWHADTFPPS